MLDFLNVDIQFVHILYPANGSVRNNIHVHIVNLCMEVLLVEKSQVFEVNKNGRGDETVDHKRMNL